MFGLAHTGDILNMGYMYYQQSDSERHPNLGLKFEYLKDLDAMDPFNIIGVDL